jgi:ribosome-binding factor A
MSHRQERVAHELRNRLAEIIEQRVADPRLRQVTITGVRVSPDLSFARVYYRSLGKPEEAHQAFAKAKPFMRRCLGEGLRLRRVPELDFRIDESLDNAARIDEILDELQTSSKSAPERSDEEPA